MYNAGIVQNKLNLELKYFCDDFDEIRKTLKRIGAKKVTTKGQKDYFFNLPASKSNPRLKLRIEGKNQTLVYYERPDFEQGKATTAKVTLLPVKDKKLLNFLKKSLGVKAVVEKTREQWSKSNAVFNLDKVKCVGNIFEIEVTSKGAKQDEATFDKYQELFSPYLTKLIKGSNIDLVSKIKK